MRQYDEASRGIAAELKYSLDWRPRGMDIPAHVMTKDTNNRVPPIRLWRCLAMQTIKELQQREHELSDNQTQPGDLPTIYKELREDVYTMAHRLDQLNAQLHNPACVTTVVISGPETGLHRVPFYELDLGRFDLHEQDTRTPIIFIGGGMADAEQNTALSLALALQGYHVFIPSFPERSLSRPGDWRQRVQTYGNGGFDLHQRVLSQAITELAKQKGITQIDLLGHSIGGCIALSLALQEEPPVPIRYVSVADPMGFETVSPIARAFQFCVVQGLISAVHVEDYITILLDGDHVTPMENADWLLLAKLTGKKVFSTEVLQQIKAEKCFIFVGDKSPLVHYQAVQQVVQGTDTTRVHCTKVRNSDHAGFVNHPFGFIRVLQSMEYGIPQEQIDLNIANASSPIEMLLQNYLC